MLSSVLPDPALHIHRHPPRTSLVSPGRVESDGQSIVVVCQCEGAQGVGGQNTLTGRRAI